MITDPLGASPWRALVLTLFPEMFPGPLGHSLAGRALQDGRWSLETRSIREHGIGRHRQVDDTPCGGGAGMVMRADVLDAALGELDGRPLVLLTPRGVPLTQARIEALAAGPGVALVCGRFEGVDQRFTDARGAEEISVGDYVLSGGEPAALVLLDACVRLLPGTMGKVASGDEESFANGLLEYPHYTRPAEWRGLPVPEVLLSGDHGRIRAWRRAESEQITRQRRPDLWAAYQARRRDETDTDIDFGRLAS